MKKTHLLRFVLVLSIFSPSLAHAQAWVQIGNDIDGEATNDESGRSVSLNADGTVLAIGALYNDENGNNAGHVRVYDWDPVLEVWDQKGLDIDGEATGDQSGYSVSLSADGTILAISTLGAWLGHHIDRMAKPDRS